MSSKFCFDLNKRLNNLQVEANTSKSIETQTAYHPFKYCLRYKHVPSPSYARKFKDELESERSTNVSLQTEDSIASDINEDCDDQNQKVDSRCYQTERYILQANKKNLSITQKIQRTPNKTNSSTKSLSQNVSSVTKPSTKLSRNCSHLIQKPKLHSSNILSQKSNVKNRQSKQAVWRTSANHSFKNSGVCKKKQQNAYFGYDLSLDELNGMSQMKNAMKPPLKEELSLLRSGQRLEYLSQRYLRGPECKYNYPEATSWRIGWLQKQKNEAN